MAALNVVFSSDGHYATWAQPRLAFIVKAAVLELSHIRNLHLSPRNLADVDYKEIIELLDAPAPFLETVEITDANLPVNLFAGDSPRLTGLVLSTCTFDMQLPIVANLRTLKLRHAPADNRIPVDQLISALSTMSRLEALHVIDSLDDHHGVTAIHPAQQVAQLPHLIELSIDCLLSNCISLLNRIVYPTSTRVCAKYQTDLSGKDDDISVVRSFAKELGSRAPGPIRSVMLDEHGIKVWQSPHAPASSPNLEITLPVLSKHEPAAKRFIRSLDLTRLKTLILHCPFSPKFLTTSFGELRHLTTVIAGDNAFMFLSALAVGLPRKTSSTTDGADADAGPSDKSKLTFLSFKTLQIEGWQFDELRQGGNTVFEVLKSCLRRRNEAGAPLPKLAIQSCLHGKEHLYVRALRAVVGEVEWDGASNQEDSDECEGCGHRR
ncbi:hypothetical protein DXG03_001127 [Asterophora parasitica]|uniref:F-box domain-containing protein n=1 Tax=Asterophora parasitica TaxID=117018 RepID=A0A9P7GHK7_9AGAR|nr:hypothetical protein DXG03_001127 [Asterophora parasitica]